MDVSDHNWHNFGMRERQHPSENLVLNEHHKPVVILEPLLSMIIKIKKI